MIYSSGTKKFNATTRATVGKAVSLALKRPETENHYIYINDFTTTQNQLLEKLEAQSGCKWKIITKDAYELRKEGEALFYEGDFTSAVPKLLLGNLLGEGHGTLIGDDLLANAALGLEKKELDEIIVEALNSSQRYK